MTLVGVMLFLLLLWESFVTQRVLVTNFVGSTNLEWVDSKLVPVEFHTFNSQPKLYI